MAQFGRRALLQGLGAGLAAWPFRAAAAAGPLFAAALVEGDAHAIAILDRDGAILRRLPLPGRGHDVTQGRGWLVAFARRPGTFALAIDPAGGRAPVAFAAPPGRHFYGHGVFTPDGLLAATENDYEAGRGMLGLYDPSDGFARIGEWPTHGIGPHDLALLPGGARLAVANGGMDTHPDTGREILNLAFMEPSVAFLDARDGTLLERHTLPAAWSRHSTRHMDLLPDGSVFVGCQWQGAAAECPPLLLRFRFGEGHAALPLGAAERAFDGYVGSVAANPARGTVALTSPHGDVAAVVEGATGRLLHLHRQAEVCGVAPAGAGFVRSSGTGAFGPARHAGLAFDNHVLALDPASRAGD